MSTDANSKTKPAPDPAAAVAAFWTRWLEQSSRGTQALLEAVQSVGDPQKMQRQWLDAVAQSVDDFMRTPVFLEAMKRNLKAITDLKGMQDQVIEGTARQFGMPLASDITGLFERLQSSENTVLNRLRGIEDRLKAIESKLGPPPGQ